MLLKALDLLRMIGYGIVSFIYNLIDSLFSIIRELNSFDIIGSLAENKIFTGFYSSIIVIAITLFGLFVIWQYVNKTIDPDEGLSIKQITMEVVKCGFFIILSTFLFTQVSDFSIKLSGFTANIFESNSGIKMSDNMLNMYVDFTPGYKANDKFMNEDIKNLIVTKDFQNKELYNDKYVTDARWILPDKKDYKYSINWIMAILCGGFFLYSLFFAGMMLGRRQIEFLFLFVISPIIFATSVGNKQRRGAVIESLVSLTLQSAVVMIIINITALIMEQVNATTFFPSSPVQDIVIKSLLYIGCGSFLLTGSQVINRFIGANVSAASGREQLMSLMSFGHTMGMATGAGSNVVTGAGMVGGGMLLKGANSVANFTGLNKAGDNILSKVGSKISGFGNAISGGDNSNRIAPLRYMGGKISSLGGKLQKDDLISSKLKSSSSNMYNSGKHNLANAVRTVIPRSNFYNPYMNRHKD